MFCLQWFQGWTAEGYQRFDVLYSMVRADCARETRTGFEDELRRMVAEENSRKSQTKQNEEYNGKEIQYLSLMISMMLWWVE
jgi:hypothetical protein